LRVDWLTPSSPRWVEILEAARYDFYHLPGYVRLCGETDGGAPGALLIDDGGEACLWPLLERSIPGQQALDLTSPYGYPGPVYTSRSPAVAADLLTRGLPRAFEMLRDRGCVTLFSRLHPILNAEPDGHTSPLMTMATVVEHGATISLDLGIPLSESFSQYRETARRHVRLAKKRGYVATHDPQLARLADFIPLYHDTMRRIGASAYYMFPESYFEALRLALGSRAFLWLAERDGRVGAAVLFTEVCGLVQYHLSANDAELSKDHPTKLLIDAVRCWGHERGAELLHLGGGVGGSTEDSLFFFKSGFSSRRHTFRTVRAVLDEEGYARLTNEMAPGEDPLFRAGFFPAYRKP